MQQIVANAERVNAGCSGVDLNETSGALAQLHLVREPDWIVPGLIINIISDDDPLLGILIFGLKLFLEINYREIHMISPDRYLYCIIPSLLIVAVPDFSYAKSNDVRVTYDSLVVPKFHGEEDRGTHTLKYAVLKKRSMSPNTVIIYLAGGPGQSATRLARFYEKRGRLRRYFRILLNHGPVYFLDQRGTGGSEPKLRCTPEVQPTFKSNGAKEDYDRLARTIIDTCMASLKSRHDDLRSLTTLQSTHDLEALRNHIGVDKIILFGESYGSHLALSYIREFGAHVERAILVSVEGPDHTWKLPQQFDRALERIDAYRAGLDLPAVRPLIDEVLDKAKHGNLDYETYDIEQNRMVAGKISRFELGLFIRNLAFRGGIRGLYATLRGQNYHSINTWLRNWRSWQSLSLIYYVTDCASGASVERLDRINNASDTMLGSSTNYPFPDICASVVHKKLDDTFRADVRSTVPVLAFSGWLDYKTPPENARDVARGFDTFVHVIDKTGFHFRCTKPACLERLHQFLSAPAPDLKSDEIMIE